jgi:hypothetical protein
MKGYIMALSSDNDKGGEMLALMIPVFWLIIIAIIVLCG